MCFFGVPRCPKRLFFLDVCHWCGSKSDCQVRRRFAAFRHVRAFARSRGCDPGGRGERGHRDRGPETDRPTVGADPNDVPVVTSRVLRSHSERGAHGEGGEKVEKRQPVSLGFGPMSHIGLVLQMKINDVELSGTVS